MKYIGRMALLTIAAASSPAFANWQYTHWGMSPEQVIAASNGAAHPGSGDMSAQGDGTADVIGSYDANGRIFKATFYFQTGRLAFVTLGNNDWQSCVQTAHDLQAVYGSPVETHGGRVAGNATWLDRSKNNRVKLVVVEGAYCELQYGPLASDAASAL